MTMTVSIRVSPSCVSFVSIPSPVTVFHLSLRTHDQRQFIRSAGLIPQVAHHTGERHRCHPKIFTDLLVGFSGDESPQYEWPVSRVMKWFS